MSSIEQGVGEAGDVFGGRKQAGMRGDAAEDESVFVLNFALDDSVAEGAAGWAWAYARRHRCGRHIADRSVRATLFLFFAFVGGGRDMGARLWGRVEGCVGHGERAEDFALGENIERFRGDAFESGTEDEESDVAVFSVGAGIGCEGNGESGSQQGITRARFEEQFLVGGKARGVSEEHAEGDAVATGIGFAGGVGQEFRGYADYWGIEFEAATLIEDCGHGGGRDDFGQGCEVEGSGYVYPRRICFVSEVAEGFLRDQTVALRDCEGCGGEGAGGNRILQNGEGGREKFILMVERRDESWRVIQGFGTRCGIVTCAGYSRVGGMGKACGPGKILTTEDTGDTD